MFIFIIYLNLWNITRAQNLLMKNYVLKYIYVFSIDFNLLDNSVNLLSQTS